MRSPTLNQDPNEAAQLQTNGAHEDNDSTKVIVKPAPTDVLFGRGVATNRNPGNENFRSIVNEHVEMYLTSTKKQKTMISRSVVNKVSTELDPPGKFLERNAKTGLWQEVNIKRALEKTAQALRDGVALLRKQLSEDMSDPAFMDAIFDGNDASLQKGKKHQRDQASQPMADGVLSSSSLRQKKQRLNPDVEALYDQSVPQKNFMYQSQVVNQPVPVQIPTNDEVRSNNGFNHGDLPQQPLADDFMPLPMTALHDDEYSYTTSSMDVFLKSWGSAFSTTNEDFLKVVTIDNESIGRVDESDCDEGSYTSMDDIHHEDGVPSLLQ